MNQDLAKEIIDNLEIILFRPLLLNNFPFDKNYLKRKNLVKTYLKFQVFQNRFLKLNWRLLKYQRPLFTP